MKSSSYDGWLPIFLLAIYTCSFISSVHTNSSTYCRRKTSAKLDPVLCANFTPWWHLSMYIYFSAIASKPSGVHAITKFLVTVKWIVSKCISIPLSYHACRELTFPWVPLFLKYIKEWNFFFKNGNVFKASHLPNFYIQWKVRLVRWQVIMQDPRVLKVSCCFQSAYAQFFFFK